MEDCIIIYSGIGKNSKLELDMFTDKRHKGYHAKAVTEK